MRKNVLRSVCPIEENSGIGGTFPVARLNRTLFHRNRNGSHARFARGTDEGVRPYTSNLAGSPCEGRVEIEFEWTARKRVREAGNSV